MGYSEIELRDTLTYPPEKIQYYEKGFGKGNPWLKVTRMAEDKRTLELELDAPGKVGAN